MTVRSFPASDQTPVVDVLMMSFRESVGFRPSLGGPRSCLGCSWKRGGWRGQQNAECSGGFEGECSCVQAVYRVYRSRGEDGDDDPVDRGEDSFSGLLPGDDVEGCSHEVEQAYEEEIRRSGRVQEPYGVGGSENADDDVRDTGLLAVAEASNYPYSQNR